MLPMRLSFAWLLLAILTLACFIELLRADPLLSPSLAGAGLLLIGILGGLRWGTNAATRLISDLSRTNSYLAEQNDELSELNYELLAHLNETISEEAHHE